MFLIQYKLRNAEPRSHEICKKNIVSTIYKKYQREPTNQIFKIIKRIKLRWPIIQYSLLSLQ